MEEEGSMISTINSPEIPYLSGIDPKLLDRLINLLKNISNLDQQLNILKIESSVQTDFTMEELTEKLTKSEETILNLKKKKKNYKNQMLKLKLELEEISNGSKKLTEEVQI